MVLNVSSPHVETELLCLPLLPEVSPMYFVASGFILFVAMFWHLDNVDSMGSSEVIAERQGGEKMTVPDIDTLES